MWSRYDWSQSGEEWSNSPEWKACFLTCVLTPHIPLGSRVLEIGPGAGRWTEHLIKRASHLSVVDLTPRCIDMCKARFGTGANIEYHVNDGSDLSFMANNSIERVFSWDVFVHICASDVKTYMSHFKRILVPGGRALLHHSKHGVSANGWRSDMTAAQMIAFCDELGLVVVDQFNRWDEGRVCIWPNEEDWDLDIVSIIEKPREIG
jgi:ubiquinone/menaquinone biosynthesis C-methylase UbiE